MPGWPLYQQRLPSMFRQDQYQSDPSKGYLNNSLHRIALTVSA
jgi:hypothetical protein